MNSGKFPSPTSAQKEVGGGYYSIRKMLQEMEYNFKLSSLEKLPVTKENKKQNKSEDTVIASPSQQVSNSQITMDHNLYEDAWLESVGNLDKNSKGLQPSTSKNITRVSFYSLCYINMSYSYYAFASCHGYLLIACQCQCRMMLHKVRRGGELNVMSN